MNSMKRIALALLSIVAALSLVTNAKALTCYGLTDTKHLLIFDSATPGTVTDQTIMGLGAFDLVGVAMRTTTQTVGAANPGVGSLWALGNDGTNFKLFIISPNTTPITATATAISGNLTSMAPAIGGVGIGGWGFAFNPALDRFQAVGVFYNYQLDPNLLTSTRGPNVFTVDPVNGVNMNPAFSGAAFTTASFGGTSTFYIADTGVHRLAHSANITAGGTITSDGALNYNAALNGGQSNGLAIDQGLALFAPSTKNLYSLNLSTGVATSPVAIAGNPTLRSLVIQPASFPPVLSVTVKISGKKKITTTKTSLKIKGTAACEAGITLVQYKIGKGKFKNANGTTSWSFKAKFKPGLNKITVVATGGNAVQSSPATIKVKVTP